MTAHLQRAQQLLSQSRPELAEQELRKSLAEDPHNPHVHGMLAICLSEMKRYGEASEAAAETVRLAPDDAYGHYVNSIVFAARNRFPEAERAIQEAIALEPDDADHHAQLASICFAGRRWKDALDAAERGLAIDPEDVSCTNLRARALVMLGQKTGARDAISTALKRDPEDAVSHANMGWALLEHGQHEQAMGHFREALRLDPQLDWARAGMVESMKGRYFIYRIMLSYFLWMMKLAGRAQWSIVIGGYIGYNVLRRVAQNNPQLAPYLMPLIIAYIVFAVMTWLAVPLFDLVLRLSRDGRLALSREQIITSNWVGGFLLGAVGSLIAYFVTQNEVLLMAALVCGLMIPPVSQVYHCEEGWPRNWMIAISLGLLVLGALGVGLSAWTLNLEGEAANRVGAFGSTAYLAFVMGAIGSQFAANALVGRSPRR